MYDVSNRLGKTFYVSFGSNSLLKRRSSIKAKATYHHPNTYKSRNETIGLIELEEDIIFNENVQPVKLPKSSSDPIGDSVVIAGWGSSKFRVCISMAINI